MLIEFGMSLGNGIDVVSSYNDDTKVWTTQVYNINHEPICDPVISRDEEEAKFVSNEIAKGFNNTFISGYVNHDRRLE